MDTKLQVAIKKANIEVEKAGITDLEFKKIAFSKAVDFYLHNEKYTMQQSDGVRVNDDDQANFWDVFSSFTGIEIKILKDVYSIKDDQICLVIKKETVPGQSKTDQQRSLAALILFAYYGGLGYEWVSSRLLAEAAKHTKFYDSSKFAKNLKSDWFRSKGVTKGLKYKLSGPGTSHAKKLLLSITQ